MLKRLLIAFIQFCLTQNVMGAVISGTFSSDHELMKCQGSWSHPFIPLDGTIHFGTPDGALLRGESHLVKIDTSADETSVNIQVIKKKGKTQTAHLKVGRNPGVKLKLQEGNIILTQYRSIQSNWDYGMYLGSILNQRFKAVLSLDENENLVLENYSADGLGRLKLAKRCVLPKVDD
jgi:hypothetical protein